MKFKLDENMPEARRRSSLLPGTMLRPRCDKGWAGARIRMWPPHAERKTEPLITLDTDCADVRTYPPQHFAGIIVLRLADQEKVNVLAVVTRLVDPLGSEQLSGRLWIVDEHRIRIRPGDA